MIKRSTFSDLISYAYNETGLHDSDRIQRIIDGDPIIAEEYKEINSVLEVLGSVTPEINPDTIKRILSFS